MNFAKSLLSKYGWKEGDGLGRDKNGITKPLKANFKFDNAGLGHNHADDMNNHWWENVYNNASKNLNIATNESNEIKIGLKSDQSVEISTKNYSLNNQLKISEYGGTFLKSATLTSEGQEVKCEHKQEINPFILRIVSDDELFKACGGRTAHKGARHGLKLSGKLSRIEQQERELMSKIRSSKEESSQAFKEYADCKSRYNKKKLKRLNKKNAKKLRESETVTSEEMLLVPEQMEEDTEQTNKKSRHNNVLGGKVEKRMKRKHQKKLKKLSKEMHVFDSKDNFLKKMAFEEISISFNPIKTLKKPQVGGVDDVSLQSYRCNDEQSQSDNENEVKQNIQSQLSEKLKEVKKKKHKVIVENLTEFQMEHLRKAHVPYVEIKQASRKSLRKNEAKINNLVNNLSIL